MLTKLAPHLPGAIKHYGYVLLELGQCAVGNVHVNERPIFVLGNHKAGTTAIAALLSKISAVTVSIDLKKQIHRPQYDQVRNGVLQFEDFLAHNRLDFSRQIIKDNQLLFLLDRLSFRFPHARYVYVARDPRDNLRSILNRLQLAGNRDLAATDIVLRDAGWRGVIDNRWLGIDRQHYIDQLAERWNAAADVYLTHRELLRLLRYEDFVADKVGRLAELANQLGLPHDNDISAWLDVQFQPPGDRQTSWENFFGVKNLTRVESICGDRMQQLGYA